MAIAEPLLGVHVYVQVIVPSRMFTVDEKSDISFEDVPE